MSVHVYDVSILQPTTGISRRRRVVCEKREHIERVLVLSPTEQVTTKTEVFSHDALWARYRAKRPAGVKARDGFYGLMRTYLDVKTDMAFALAKSVRQVSSPSLSIAICRVLDDLEDGVSLAIALERLKGALPETDVEALIAGAEVAAPVDVLTQLQRKSQYDLAVQGKIKKAVVYPLIVLTVGCFVATTMATKQLPMMAKTFSSFGVSADEQTASIFSLGKIISDYPFIGYLPVAMIVLPIFFQRQLFLSRPGQYVILKMPALRKLIFKGGMTSALSTYALLRNAGVPLVRTLTLTARATTVPQIQRFFLAVREALDKGKPTFFEAAIGHADLLGEEGYEFVSLMEAGDHSGNNAPIAQKVADTYQRETEESVDILSQFLSPIIIFIAGGVVVLVVLMVLGPMGSLESHMLPAAGVINQQGVAAPGATP
jgi:type II secretory pathway component PulF